MTAIQSAYLVAALVTIGTGGTVLVAALWRPFYRLFKKIDQVHDAVLGQPAQPGLAKRPGLVDRVATVETTVQTLSDALESRPTIESNEKQFNAVHSEIASLRQHVTRVGGNGPQPA